VAGRNHDSAGALLVAHQKRKLRRAAVVVEEEDLETIRHHDRRTQFREPSRVVPRVVGNGARERRLVHRSLR
jgi:hypothetical protein